MKFDDKDFLIAIADGRATSEEMEHYRELCKQDPRIETYVALLRATRQRIRIAAQRQIERQSNLDITPIPRHTVSASGIVRLPVRWLSAAVAAVAAIVFFILAPWQQRAVDFRTESLENFQAIVGGKLTVAKATNDFATLAEFFRSQGISYRLVDVPFKATLVGGVVSEHNGTKLAHFVYRRGDTLIYMYQAPEELFERGILAVPASVEPYVHTGKWYAENVSAGSWMFWRVQSVYCSVVANVPKDILATYFVEGAS
ncbi:MAG: hypothetical protein N2663_04655 [Chlorobi bacterium]|nr:hypothetical protein [Chlorobiota bacterium]